ncbi:protein FAM151B isoform X2 [Nematostella vectensis]|uniref:protein FAM151B isoform X2 n=1 Tax=Nematostella vectensis TaxID=45351 RepID=UPI002076F32F|nr:protein FAM151B isoform X2 [Nematostella vectensis]
MDTQLQEILLLKSWGIVADGGLGQICQPTLGSYAVEFFGLRSCSQVTWSHAVNSRERLQAAVTPTSSTMMLEADVILSYSKGIPVMAHPPSTDSNLTLEEFLQISLGARRGVKLDFKTLEAVKPSLDILASKSQHFIDVPVFLNADILSPSCVNKTAVDAKKFIQYCTELFPRGELSLGWVSHSSPESHARECHRNGHLQWETVHEMASLCKPLKQSVTFPVNVRVAYQNLEQVKWLLHQSTRYSLTLWVYYQDNVPLKDLVYLYKDLINEKVYYDLAHLEDKLNEELPENIRFRQSGKRNDSD